MSSNPFEPPDPVPGNTTLRWRPEARHAVFAAGIVVSTVGVAAGSPEVVIAGMTLGSAATWAKRRAEGVIAT